MSPASVTNRPPARVFNRIQALEIPFRVVNMW